MFILCSVCAVVLGLSWLELLENIALLQKAACYAILCTENAITIQCGFSLI
jgi:hypothetical protein